MAADKEFTAKIAPQAITKHGDIELIHHIGELTDLSLGQKLALIHQYTMQPLLAVVGGNQVHQVIFTAKYGGIGLNTNT